MQVVQTVEEVPEVSAESAEHRSVAVHLEVIDGPETGRLQQYVGVIDMQHFARRVYDSRDDRLAVPAVSRIHILLETGLFLNIGPGRTAVLLLQHLTEAFHDETVHGDGNEEEEEEESTLWWYPTIE